MKKILLITIIVILLFVGIVLWSYWSFRTGPVPSYIRYTTFSPNISYELTIWGYDPEHQEVVSASPNNTLRNHIKNNHVISFVVEYNSGVSLILSTAPPASFYSGNIIEEFERAGNQIVKGIEEIYFCGVKPGERLNIYLKGFGSIPVPELKNVNCVDKFITELNNTFCCITLESPSKV